MSFQNSICDKFGEYRDEFAYDSPSEKVYRFLRKLILEYEIPPGQHLYIRELSEALQISQTPIREALSRLRGAGMINSIPKKGYFVPVPDMKDLIVCYELLEEIVSGLGKEEFIENQKNRSNGRVVHLQKTPCGTAINRFDDVLISLYDLECHSIRKQFLSMLLNKTYFVRHYLKQNIGETPIGTEPNTECSAKSSLQQKQIWLEGQIDCQKRVLATAINEAVQRHLNTLC
ncbi:MAG: GntR family transcriptional regulator [Pseudomonadota bacterium]